MSNRIYTIDEIKAIVEPIAKLYGVKRVFLFGSYARGEATPTSDLDFRIDKGSLRGLFALGGLYADLEERFEKELVEFARYRYPELLQEIKTTKNFDKELQAKVAAVVEEFKTTFKAEENK